MFEVQNINPVEGGFEVGNSTYILNSEQHDRVFKVVLGTGTYQGAVFYADAYTEQGAVDRVVDFCEENEYRGYYSEYEDLVEEAEQDDVDTTTEDGVDNYIMGLGLVAAGNASHYIELIGLEEVED